VAEGLKYLKASAALHDSALVHYHLGRVAQLQGDHDLANEEWHKTKKAIDQLGSSPDIQYVELTNPNVLIARPLHQAMQSAK
jgi:hypothetical protein